MRFVAVALALATLAACEKPADKGQQVASNKQANASEVASSAVAAAAAKPLSKEAALKLMHDRHENMEKIGDANKAIRRQLAAPTPDLAEIRASAATIAKFAPQVPSWFPAGTGPDIGKTEAKAEIWKDPKDFAAKTRDFQKAALALDAAAKAGDLTRIKASFGDLGKTCKGCHDLYREEH
jgi:cytochrome c556